MDTKVISSGKRYTSLPESYIRPESDRPKLSEVSTCENVPVIDLGCANRAQIVEAIAYACSVFGFFQVVNHGVSEEAVADMLRVATEFFGLPVEEKLKLYSDDPSKTMRLSTSFNVNKEKVHNWRDYLRLHCHPLEKYVPEWPSNPSSFNLGADVMYDPLCLPHLVRLLSILLNKSKSSSQFPGTGCDSAIGSSRDYSDRCNSQDVEAGCNSAGNAGPTKHPIAYISSVIRNATTFDRFLALVDEANLAIADLTGTLQLASLLPYMQSYDRSSIRLFRLSSK